MILPILFSNQVFQSLITFEELEGGLDPESCSLKYKCKAFKNEVLSSPPGGVIKLVLNLSSIKLFKFF